MIKLLLETCAVALQLMRQENPDNQISSNEEEEDVDDDDDDVDAEVNPPPESSSPGVQQISKCAKFHQTKSDYVVDEDNDDDDDIFIDVERSPVRQIRNEKSLV